jgi:excisionase family DNA binding protein
MITARYIGIKELSGYLSVPIGSLYVMVCEKRIPYLKIGRRLKFDLQEIEQWLKDKRIKELALTKLNGNV